MLTTIIKKSIHRKVFWNWCVNGALTVKRRFCLCKHCIFLFTGKVVPVILPEFTGITVKGLQLQLQPLEIQLSYASWTKVVLLKT